MFMFFGDIFVCVIRFFFFFNDTATTEIYTLSLHDALPILLAGAGSQTGSKRSRAIAHLADLAGTRCGNVPGVPRRREHVLATEQKTSYGVIRSANLVVEGGNAGAGLRR